MSSGFWHLKKKVGIRLCFLNGIAWLGEKWIVSGINQKGGNGKVGEELFTARLTPVVFCVLETVDRCSIALIKILECFDSMVPLIADLVRHYSHFCLDLLMEHASESNHIQFIRQPCHVRCTGA